MLLRIQSENSEHFLGAVEHLLATGVPCPTAGAGQLLRFGQIGLTSHQSLLGALALGQIEHECDALVTALFKCCPTNQHGHTATVFSREFFFERLEPAATFLLFDPCVIPVAPVGRRQVRPPYAARNQVFTVVAHHAKKFAVSLKNATFEIPDENSDDVGIDQAANPGLPFPEIVVQAHVFDGDHRLVGEGLDKRDLFVGEWSDLPPPDQNCSNGGAPAQQRCRERGAMALAFCESAAHPVLALLYSEIMDMNGPTIACGSSVHRVSVYEKTPVRIDKHWNFPV